MCGKLHAVLSFILQITTCICPDMELNWNKYIICQEEAGEPLRCPLFDPAQLTAKLRPKDCFWKMLISLKQ